MDLNIIVVNFAGWNNRYTFYTVPTSPATKWE